MQFLHRLAVAGQTFGQHLVIGCGRRGHHRGAAGLQAVPASQQVIADERNMLNSLAIVFAQEFFNLAAASLAFFIQGDTDFAVRRGHRLAGQTGIFALDVKIADLAEVEDPLIKRRPVRHAPAVDVVRQVIDQLEAGPHRIAVRPGFVNEIDVIDAEVVTVPVNQVDDRSANPSDSRQTQFHHPGAAFHRLRAARDGLGIGLGRVVHAKTHAAGRRAMLCREIGGGAARFVIGDQVDFALPPQLHVF